MVGPDSIAPPLVITISAVHSKVPVDWGTKVPDVTVLSVSDAVVTGSLSVKTGLAPWTPQVPGAQRKKSHGACVRVDHGLVGERGLTHHPDGWLRASCR